MTQIVNLPELTTITNTLIFPAADTADGNRTKKVTLAQLVALSAGPRGPIGVPGSPGPIGPSGPLGPGANQSLDTTDDVTFKTITVTDTNSALTFGDGTIQKTAYRKAVLDLVGFSFSNVTLTSLQLNYTILSGNPIVPGRNLFLPAAGSDVEGLVLIVRNRNASFTFNVWGGLINLGAVPVNGSIRIACDGYSWFTY